MEVLQTSALPLGDGADWNQVGNVVEDAGACQPELSVTDYSCPPSPRATAGNLRVQSSAKIGAGNGIRTRDFDLGKVALYH